jgi:hypothetical protein
LAEKHALIKQVKSNNFAEGATDAGTVDKIYQNIFKFVKIVVDSIADAI